jgi:hypothetical protein
VFPKQGNVYYISSILPPESSGNTKPHYFLCLMNSSHIRNFQHPSRNKGFFVLGCIIRSAVSSTTGKLVPLVQGYSFKIQPTEYSFLKHDSIVETHQLFHVHYPEFDHTQTREMGSLYMPNDKEDSTLMNSILDASKSLLNF